MGRVGVGCDTWMKNIGMDEDICMYPYKCLNENGDRDLIGNGDGGNNGCQSIHPHKLT
jgi:hypothetical protein